MEAGIAVLAFLPALVSLALLIFVGALFVRLVRAAEGARDALRDLADRFPRMNG
jgi:hypothetical protein